MSKTKKTTAVSDQVKAEAKAAKIALTPQFVQIFGKQPTNLQTAAIMQKMIDAHNSSGTATNNSTEVNVSASSSEASQDIESSGTSSQIESASSATTRAGISVVIPYLHAAAKGDELKYALRSWAQNFEWFHLVIIGDKPEWLSDEATHIPAVVSHKNPQLDVTAKLMQAIASDLVTEEFILSNDDIYLVNFVELADIEMLKADGILGQTKPNSSKGYAERLARTRQLLREARYPTHDYATHTPYLFKKEKLAKVIEKYRADQEPLLISCLYYNSVFPRETPIIIKGGPKDTFIGYVYRENPNMEVLRQAFMERKFINHNSAGYVPVLPLLEEFFPDKCKFEK